MSIISIIVSVVAFVICVVLILTSDDCLSFRLGMILTAVVLSSGLIWIFSCCGDMETSQEPVKTVTVYNDDGSVLAWYDGDVDVERDGTSVTIKVDGKTFEYINNPVAITYNEETEKE